MPDENLTPEEQLLRLVDNPNASDAKGASGGGTKASAKERASFFGLGELLPSFLRKKGKGGDASLEGAGRQSAVFNIRFWNQILVALVLAAAVYLALDLFVFKFDESKFLSQVGTNEAVFPTIDEGELAAHQKVEYYLDSFEQRNPFLSPSAIPEEDETAEEIAILSSQTNRMAEVLGGMKLVGISWAQEPLAMIEDIETGRTYFARQGQVVRGLKVQSITKEKVTVTYEGEEGFLI